MDAGLAALAAPGIPPEWLDPPDLAVAKAAQIALAARVVPRDEHPPVRLIGGVDISNTRFDPEGRIFAAVVVLEWPGLRLVATATAETRAALPYIPGYLGFREVPALLAAWAKLPEPARIASRGFGEAAAQRLAVEEAVRALTSGAVADLARSKGAP